MAEDAAPRQEGESIENIVSDETRRATWSGKAAFIIASAAASIGLGNLWRFPSLAAKYGGGMFVLTYIVLVCTLGFAYLLTETAIGRRTRKSGIAAFVAMARENGRKGGLGWKVLGSLEIIVPAIIVPYYCTIGGWITKYMVEYALGGSDVLSATDASGAPTFFGQFITSDSEPVAWTFIFCILVVLVIVLGVNNGIEKLNKYAMPALLFLAVAVMIYGLVTIPNAGAGVAYYLVPKFQDFSVMTIVAAAGQMFYSLSLGMGIMITYGSYMRREEHMESGVGSIAFFDTLVAVIAGFIVIPATFSLFGPEATRQAGAGLMFGTLPQVFKTMPFSSFVGFLYFALVFFAALTSAVALLEATVSGIQDATRLTRRQSVKVCGIGLIVLALLPTLGYSVLSWVQFPIGSSEMSILDFADFISNSVIMPFIALVVSIVIGWVFGPSYVTDEAEASGVRMRLKKYYVVLVKFVVPILLAVVLVSSILNSVGVISI